MRLIDADALKQVFNQQRKYALEESVDAANLYNYFVAVDNSRDMYESERLVTLEQYENIVVTGSKQYVDLFCGKV